MESTPTFLNPPVVEFVLGVQFSPLAEFTSAHFGLFWNQLNVESDQWTISSDAPLIEDTFELFSAPLWKQPRNLQFRLQSAPQTGRLHISAQVGRWVWDERDTLLLNMTGRGPIEDGKVSTVREGLDIGHRVSVDAFLRIASPDFQHRWGPQV